MLKIIIVVMFIIILVKAGLGKGISFLLKVLFLPSIYACVTAIVIYFITHSALAAYIAAAIAAVIGFIKSFSNNGI